MKSPKHSRSWNLVIAFVGWMLSPATWWNDAFVNIPIAYAMASVSAWLWPRSFLVAFIVSYWITNFVGTWMLYAGGKELIAPASKPVRPWLAAVFTLVYCIGMSVLICMNIVKPLPIPAHGH